MNKTIIDSATPFYNYCRPLTAVWL